MGGWIVTCIYLFFFSLWLGTGLITTKFAGDEWERLALPQRLTRWFFVLPSTLLLRRSSRTANLFLQVASSRLFATKIVAYHLWGALSRAELQTRPQLWDAIEEAKIMRKEIISVLSTSCRCGNLRGFPPLLGYASLDNGVSTRFVAGIEFWLARVPFARAGVVSHELIHIVQHLSCGVFDDEHENSITHFAGWGIELEAHVFGTPFMFPMTLSIMLTPAIMIVGAFLQG